MEPPIQYSRTSDGINIAYWTMGEGRPLIAMPSMPWSHLQLEWTIPELRSWYGRLGRNRQLIRYDGRGFGLSSRDVDSMSLDGELRDLEAVLDAIGTDRVDVYAGLHSGPPAIAYTAANPDRIDHLILFCTYADGAEFAKAPLTQATRPIITQAWDFYTEAVARLLLGWSDHDAAVRFAKLVKECCSPEMAHMALTATTTYNVIDTLPEVTTPTLIMQRRELEIGRMDDARVLASSIPDARLSVLEGSSIAPYLGDAEAVVNEIDGFLGGAIEPLPDGGAGSLRTILFTDVEGSTALTQELGDEASRALMREHERIVREALADHAGMEIKTTGDGFMASFGSAVAAVECAIALQRQFADRNFRADHPITIRVGMSAGEPIAEDDDLFGSVVNQAARIGDHADGGEIHVSDVVRQLVSGKGFRFIDLGEVVLRGFEAPVRLFEAGWAEE